MTAIEIGGGACGRGGGTYENGLFTMPDGSLRGIESVAGLDLPEAAAPVHWTGDILRGLQGALDSARSLPLPVSVAASAVGFGLGAFEGKPPTALLRVTFADGSVAKIKAPADLAALVGRDLALARALLARQAPPAQPPTMFAENAEAERATTAMFEYEKRNGRLRRKAKDATVLREGQEGSASLPSGLEVGGGERGKVADSRQARKGSGFKKGDQEPSCPDAWGKTHPGKEHQPL